MAQFARPNSDISAGGWTTVPLFEKLDEAIPDNADLISSGNNASPDVCEVGLSTVTDPDSSSSHTLRYRYRKSGAGGHNISLRVGLYQGANLVAEQLHSGITEVFTDGTFTLMAVEADTITDYSDLRLRFSREGDTGGPGGNRRSAEVSWAEVEVPEAATTPPATEERIVTGTLLRFGGAVATEGVNVAVEERVVAGAVSAFAGSVQAAGATGAVSEERIATGSLSAFGGATQTEASGERAATGSVSAFGGSTETAQQAERAATGTFAAFAGNTEISGSSVGATVESRTVTGHAGPLGGSVSSSERVSRVVAGHVLSFAGEATFEGAAFTPTLEERIVAGHLRAFGGSVDLGLPHQRALYLYAVTPDYRMRPVRREERRRAVEGT